MTVASTFAEETSKKFSKPEIRSDANFSARKSGCARMQRKMVFVVALPLCFVRRREMKLERGRERRARSLSPKLRVCCLGCETKAAAISGFVVVALHLRPGLEFNAELND